MTGNSSIPNDTNQERFVYLRSFNNYIEANIVLKMLQDAGINCHLEDEHLNTIVNLTSGMRLMVFQSQVNRAKQIMEETEEKFIASVACPHCGKQQLRIKLVEVDVKPQLGNFLSFITKLISGEDNIVTMKHYTCSNCGTGYEELPLNA
jgi:DNA-directed RNA polymerase subunit RPC12/RpoP